MAERDSYGDNNMGLSSPLNRLPNIRKSIPKLTEKIPNTQGKILNSFNTFGKPEDYIELNIYDNTNTLVAHLRDFKDYTFTEEGKTSEGLSNEVVVDPINDLKSLNFNNGEFTLEYRFQRKKIFNNFKKIFFIQEISNSRREIRIDSNDLNNLQLQERYNIFKDELDDSSTFKDFTLNFGDGVNITAVNIFLDKSQDNNSLLIKLLDPLPLTIANTFTFRIVEDLIEPAQITLNVESPPIEDRTIPIAGPNFKIDTRLNSSIPSEFKNYDELLGGGVTSSYENMLNALSSSSQPNTEYDNLVTDSGYHFENFVHFSSATERLNNFKYKLKLIELYDSQVNNINTIIGDASSSITVLKSKESIRTKKKKLIGGFDGYERFLYYESGTYSWPKSNSTKPYTQYAISTSQALTWFGSNEGASTYYGGQIYSASQFDDQNVYNLNKLIPEYIKNDSNNDQYKLFVDMVGQHFDQSWLYIKSLTENKRAENKLSRGIDKDLVYNALKGLGIQVFDEFENEDLFSYLTGINKDGTLLHQTGSGITLVTASNDGSLPKADITKEKWKRIYHNLPYLLKTKGTERGIRALITSYGIPSTILNVKEFGGSTTDKTTFKTFTHDKFSYALNGNSGTQGFFIRTDWSSSLTTALSSSAKTVEFRIKPTRTNDTYILFALQNTGHTGDIVYSQYLKLEPYTGDTDIREFGDRTQYGRLALSRGAPAHGETQAKSDYFPAYNGDFWNIHIGIDVSDSDTSPLSDDFQVQFGAYQANHLKTVNYYVTHSLFSGAQNGLAWGLSYHKSTNNVTGKLSGIHATSSTMMAGAANCYIGGIPGDFSGTNPDELSGFPDSVNDLSYKGSIQEIRYYFGELLTHETLTKHALVPSMYSGNSISSSFSNLVLRLPLGSNLHKNSQSFHPDQDTDYLNTQVGEDLIDNSNWRTNSFLTASVAANNINGLGPNITNITAPTDGFRFQTLVGSAPIAIENRNIFSNIINDAVKVTYTITDSNHPTGLAIFDSSGDERTLNTQTSSLGGPQTHEFIFDEIETNNLVLKRRISALALDITIKDIAIVKVPDIKSNMTTQTWESITETQHLTTPDTVGKSMTSEKVRIDSGEVEDNILSYDIKTETSTLDRQPTDSSDLGIYFSPSFEINKDIIYQLGSFRLDDFIGDPTHISENNYPDLKLLSSEYFKKPVGRFKYTDFINITKQFDHTLFKMIESMVPAKSNLKTGILIEPHYLERTKFGNPSTLPGVEKHNNYEVEYDIRYTSENSDFDLKGQYLLTEVNYNIKPESQFITFDSGSPLLNNAVNSRTSKKYYRKITSQVEEL